MTVPNQYPFTLPPLPYDYNAFEPVIDQETMRLHHDKHHQAYVEKLNALLKDYPALHAKSIEALLGDLDAIPEAIRDGVRNQGGGHANHAFFWEILGAKQAAAPSGALAQAIDAAFGGFDKFKAAFKESAAKHFGSGWTFLAASRSDLEIFSLPNQDSPLSVGKTGILCCDLWEHAFYLKHKNRKEEWLDAFWNVVSWPAAAKRFEAQRTG